jgi:tripeptide aminopeptidase
MRDVFFRLLETESPFYREKPAVDLVTAFLDEQGIPWTDDGSAPRTGCNSGNIIVEGGDRAGGHSAARLSFCAHLDTIRIFEKKAPVLEGGVVKAPGGGVLGIDDKSGTALLLELIASLHEKGGLAPDIHFLFTVCEEAGFLGARALDPRHFSGAYNFVVDSGGVPMARAVSAGAGQITWTITLRGKAAHASSGDGKNAALLAAALLSELDPGPGGRAAFIHAAALECPGSPNTVPDRAEISGQILYSDPVEAEALLGELRETAERSGGTCEARRDCAPWSVPEDDPIVVYAREAAAVVGQSLHLGTTGAGSDAQVIAERGGRVIKISTGMRNPHSGEEQIDLEDMKRCFAFLWALAGRKD